MYGIYRRTGHQPAVHSASWHVDIQRATITYSKVFSDSRYGGEAAALTAARQFRDQVLHDAPPLLRKIKAQRVTASCTSGVPGVVREDRILRHKNGPYRVIAWKAQIQLAPGKTKTRSFSIKKYGEQEAFELAVQARLCLLEEMEGYVLHSSASQRLQAKIAREAGVATCTSQSSKMSSSKYS